MLSLTGHDNKIIVSPVGFSLVHQTFSFAALTVPSSRYTRSLEKVWLARLSDIASHNLARYQLLFLFEYNA